MRRRRMRHWSRSEPPRLFVSSIPHWSAMAKQLSEYKPVYLIVGEQDLLLDQAVEALKSSVAEVADLDFNLETFEGESASADDIVAACNTLPFVSERRLVIVRGVDKMSKDAAEALVRYAEDPSPTTILALVGQEAREEHPAVQGRRQARRRDRAKGARGPGVPARGPGDVRARGQADLARGRRVPGQRRRPGPAAALRRGRQDGLVRRRRASRSGSPTSRRSPRPPPRRRSLSWARRWAIGTALRRFGC